MIIGSGMLAKAFAHHAQEQQLLIFASGVSDSTETPTDTRFSADRESVTSSELKR